MAGTDRIIVVGGGAAGFFGAIAAAEAHATMLFVLLHRENTGIDWAAVQTGLRAAAQIFREEAGIADAKPELGPAATREIGGKSYMRRQDAIVKYGDGGDAIPSSTEERWRQKEPAPYQCFTSDDTHEVWVEVEGFARQADIWAKRRQGRCGR